MAFLLINKHTTSLINKVGENIYLRDYQVNNIPRQQVLVKSISDDYSANIDEKGDIHIVYKNAQNKIIYFKQNDSSMNKTLLEDTKNTYQICNINFLPHTKNYLLYGANNPYEQCSDLIFQSFTKFSQSSPRAILTLPTLTSKYQPLLHNSKLFVLCAIIVEKGFELNLYTYDIESEEWEGFDTLVSTNCPIVDFCFLIHDHTMHVTYITEKFGHYTLYYGAYNNSEFRAKEVLSLGQKIEAVVFIYNKIIWINHLSSDTLYSCFSYDRGESFSSPMKCTVQNTDVMKIFLNTTTDSGLYGNYFYGYIDKYPNIAILSQVDTDNILFYTNSSDELKEVINATISPKAPKEIIIKEDNKPLEDEIRYLKEVQKEISDKYDELATFTKEVQAEGKKWRNKYQKVLKELKDLKKKAPLNESAPEETTSDDSTE